MKIYASKRLPVNGPLRNTISISFKIDVDEINADLPDRMAEHLKKQNTVEELQELLK